MENQNHNVLDDSVVYGKNVQFLDESSLDDQQMAKYEKGQSNQQQKEQNLEMEDIYPPQTPQTTQDEKKQEQKQDETIILKTQQAANKVGQNFSHYSNTAVNKIGSFKFVQKINDVLTGWGYGIQAQLDKINDKLKVPKYQNQNNQNVDQSQYANYK